MCGASMAASVAFAFVRLCSLDDCSVLEHVLVVLGDHRRVSGLRGRLFLHGGQSDLLRSVCVVVIVVVVVVVVCGCAS